MAAHYGNPAGYSSSNLVFFNAWLDAVGTYNRYAVGSVDQNAAHVVAEAMYGSPLLVPVSDIDRCDYFLIVGANPAVNAWNWLETVPAAAGSVRWRRARSPVPDLGPELGLRRYRTRLRDAPSCQVLLTDAAPGATMAP